MTEKQLNFKTFKTSSLNVEHYPNLISQKDCEMFLESLDNLNWKQTKNRNSILFGDKGIKYTLRYWNRKTTGPEEERYNKVVKIPNRWHLFPCLKSLKKNMEVITGEHFTCCIVQKYNDGNNGISFHQDKEMVLGTTIAGVSFGATRNLRLKKRNKVIDIPLESGSLYVLKSPTNSYWFHSITKDLSIKNVRYSLTFRNYVNEKE